MVVRPDDRPALTCYPSSYIKVPFPPDIALLYFFIATSLLQLPPEAILPSQFLKKLFLGFNYPVLRSDKSSSSPVRKTRRPAWQNTPHRQRTSENTSTTWNACRKGISNYHRKQKEERKQFLRKTQMPRDVFILSLVLRNAVTPHQTSVEHLFREPSKIELYI